MPQLFGILERIECVNSASTVQKRSFSHFTKALQIYFLFFLINTKKVGSYYFLIY